MAIYHLHVSMVKRSTGRSAVAAAAYRAGERIKNERDGITHDYTRKSGVVYSEIILPENAPREFENRATLWNAVEKSEKRYDAQTAREFDIALPVEFERQEQIEIMREYIKANFINRGMCADFAIHDVGDGNPHAHIMLTTREVGEGGFGGKNRNWNDRTNLETWRENWADICNDRFKSKGLDERIDHRTLEAQGINREPTMHEGRNPEAVRENREIIKRNAERTPEETAEYMHDLKQGYYILAQEIDLLSQQAVEILRESQTLRFRAEQIEERAEQIKTMTERQYKQAANYFKRTYNIAPKQAAEEIKRLEATAQNKKHFQEELQNKIAPFAKEKEAFALEYYKHKLLAEIDPNGRKTLDELARLEKENIPQSVQDRLAWAQVGCGLDVAAEKQREHERFRYR